MLKYMSIYYLRCMILEVWLLMMRITCISLCRMFILKEIPRTSASGSSVMVRVLQLRDSVTWWTVGFLKHQAVYLRHFGASLFQKKCASLFGVCIIGESQFEQFLTTWVSTYIRYYVCVVTSQLNRWIIVLFYARKLGWGVDMQNLFSLEDVFNLIEASTFIGLKKDIWKGVVWSVLYFIWSSRNQVVFSRNGSQICSRKGV